MTAKIAKKLANSKKMNAESERYYVQKITKEIIRIWGSLEITDEQAAANETLSQILVKQMMQKMGFIPNDPLDLKENQN